MTQADSHGWLRIAEDKSIVKAAADFPSEIFSPHETFITDPAAAERWFLLSMGVCCGGGVSGDGEIGGEKWVLLGNEV